MGLSQIRGGHTLARLSYVSYGVRSPDSRLYRDSFHLNLESGDLTPLLRFNIGNQLEF